MSKVFSFSSIEEASKFVSKQKIKERLAKAAASAAMLASRKFDRHRRRSQAA